MKLQAVLSPRRAFFLAMPARGPRLAPLRIHRPLTATSVAPAPAPEAKAPAMGPTCATEAFAPEQADFLRRLREAGL